MIDDGSLVEYDVHETHRQIVSQRRGIGVRMCLQEGYRCNEELLELLLLEGERDVPDTEPGPGHTEVGAAQLGVLLLSSPLTLAPIGCRHAVPGCRPLLYCALLGLHQANNLRPRPLLHQHW